MTPDRIAELIEAAFREGWRIGEGQGRAYGFTGELVRSPDGAYATSAARKAAIRVRRGKVKL